VAKGQKGKKEKQTFLSREGKRDKIDRKESSLGKGETQKSSRGGEMLTKRTMSCPRNADENNFAKGRDSMNCGGKEKKRGPR